MKGYELIQKIANGEIKENTKIKVKTEEGYKITIIYENNRLKWKIGEFDTSILCNKHTEFELIKENKEIEEVENISYNFTKTSYTSIELSKNFEIITELLNKQSNKTNELVRAVNKLIKERETE